jgi:serine/threonine-protein kinase
MDLAGKTLLHYRVEEKIGEGGMGVVWRATDTSLGRSVAIKVLPEELAQDGARLSRFEREAKLLANLNHPQIATVHGFHEVDGAHFLAMELVAGEDLSKRLSTGPFSVDESLAIALQLAEALEAAHEQGVIHRDLKPANIQCNDDGDIKVLDFGLAKALDSQGDSGMASQSMSPTITSLGTAVGTIIGTAGYMSPEQAKARSVDKRADIWAFGVVLFEMLSGRNPFLGDSVAETLAAVLKETPDWSELPAETPTSLKKLIQRCLVKAPRSRLRDIGDARLTLIEIQSGAEELPDGAPSPSVTPRSWTRWLPWALAALTAAALITSLAINPERSASADSSESLRLSIALSEEDSVFLANLDSELMASVAISPDGQQIVYCSLDSSGGQDQLFSRRFIRSRRLDSYETEILSGSETTEQPFFSPDGQWVGFFTERELAKIPKSGGARVLVAEGIGHGTGASWGTDGKIIFAHSYVGPLWSVPENGGPPEQLTTLRDEERSHRYPHHLPDGKSALFTIKTRGMTTFKDGSIGLVDLETGEHRVLPINGTAAKYSHSGHLIVASDGKLLAAPFDIETLTITGGAVPVVDNVIVNNVSGAAMYDIAEDGSLVFIPGNFDDAATKLFRITLDGERTQLAIGAYVALPRLSPDGSRLLLHGALANDAVLEYDLDRDTLISLTDSNSNDILPVWNHDGSRIYFSTDRTGREQIVTMPAGGGESEVVVDNTDALPQEICDVSAGGERLAINHGVRSSRDIYIMEKGGKPEPFIATAANESDAIFSPDGRWIAYNSDESGSMEVYVRPYPGSGGRIQISDGKGAYYPRWSGDGGQIFYQTQSGISSVPIRWSAGRPQPGRPTKLIDTPTGQSLGYDVNAAGDTFYVIELDVDRWHSRQIDLVTHWDQELSEGTKRR